MIDAIVSERLKRKGDYPDSPVYNAGIEAQVTKDAAALLTDRLFEKFADAAREEIPDGLPLYIAGGCGLNCEWNARWRDLGHFSSVFVPPCPNDSGSAIGTAIDALAALTGEPHIDWSVYSGLEFEHDEEPDPARWEKVQIDRSGCRRGARGGPRHRLGAGSLGDRAARPRQPLAPGRPGGPADEGASQRDQAA